MLGEINVKIRLQNIGKFTEAEIELKGITVVTGANNTGKSTMGKALYCIFHSLYNLQRQIDQARRNMGSLDNAIVFCGGYFFAV